MTCITPSDCPAPANECTTATCDGGVCGFALADAGTLCSDALGTVCDGAGSCVACLHAVDCQTDPSFDPCSDNGDHTEPPMCMLGACVPGMVTHCADTGMICTQMGCGPCMKSEDCGPPEDCFYKGCNAVGMCKKIGLPQGSNCLSPANGTCTGANTCVSSRYVFVTSTTFPSTFGGTQTADTMCGKIAMGVGLGGTWKSWTSDGAGSTPAGRFMPSPGSYMLLDDMNVVATSWGKLTSGVLAHGIDVDEKKDPVMIAHEVWTGTATNGTYAGTSCGNWQLNGQFNPSAVVGVAGNTDDTWTAAPNPGVCSAKARLYCFQQ